MLGAGRDRLRHGLVVGVAWLVGSCATPTRSAAPAVDVEAGFIDVPPRNVTVGAAAVSIQATARVFYNLRPAEKDPETRPIFFLNNGFAAEIVRAYGTGPTTVIEGGSVVDNPTPLTRYANLVYVEPRQAGYSYDVVAGRAPTADDCSPSIFNEYVDAADVLWAALAFLSAHPQLRGPVYWVGESYAGVRVTWILAYLRGRWGLANYADPSLAALISRFSQRAEPLAAGQVLLEPWLAGGAETNAINAECTDPTILARVSAQLPAPCSGVDACACAMANDRSPYNVGYTVERQTQRESEASAVHIFPDRADALLGVAVTSIDGLSEKVRATGFKCSQPDSSVPSQDPLVAALGPLPAGQAYYVPYSPLLPGKETAPTTRDWQTQNAEGLAFVDNLRDVPTFITNGWLDLVVPTAALAPALRTIPGVGAIDTTVTGRLGVAYPDGQRFATVADFPGAGHMITMLAAADLAADLQAWLPAPADQ